MSRVQWHRAVLFRPIAAAHPKPARRGCARLLVELGRFALSVASDHEPDAGLSRAGVEKDATTAELTAGCAASIAIEYTVAGVNRQIMGGTR